MRYAILVIGLMLIGCSPSDQMQPDLSGTDSILRAAVIAIAEWSPHEEIQVDPRWLKATGIRSAPGDNRDHYLDGEPEAIGEAIQAAGLSTCTLSAERVCTLAGDLTTYLSLAEPQVEGNSAKVFASYFVPPTAAPMWKLSYLQVDLEETGGNWRVTGVEEIDYTH